ncbi:MAG: LamG domain-containing protein [Kiritimatiellales bacterium]|nr:LamG domain-containing protein [Kiritimatiellales bacterium]
MTELFLRNSLKPRSMLINKRHALSMIAASLILLIPLSASALDLDDIGFIHTFERGLAATSAGGNTEPVDVIGEPKIVAGRNGGKALRLRNGIDAVGFEVDGNLTPRQGALSLWMAPGANWGYLDAEGNPIFGGSQVLFHTGDIDTPPHRLVLQTYWRSQMIGTLAYADGKLTGGWSDGVFQTVFPYPNLENWPAEDAPRQWNHFLFTWRDGRLESYVNGERVKQFQRPDLVFRQFGERFYIGWKRDPDPQVDTEDEMLMTKDIVAFDPGFVEAASKQMDTPWETHIADVVVFNQFLSEAQVKGIYEKGAVAYTEQAAAGTVGIPENALLFHASFDEGFAPDISRSLDPDKIKTAGEPTRVDGKSGKALRVVSRKRQERKDPSAAVTYPLSRNLNADAGTIAFWVSSENWDTADGVLQILFTTSGVRRFQVQTNPENRSSMDFLWFTGRYINEKVGGYGNVSTPLILHDTLIEGIERMKPGAWYHIAYTWEEGQVVAYRNGQQVAKAAFPRFEDQQTQELGNRFSIGDYPFWSRRFVTGPDDLQGKQYAPGYEGEWLPLMDDTFATLIDEFVIFDRPLDAFRIERLAKLGVSRFMEAERSGTAVANLTVKALPTLGRVVFDAYHPTAPDGAKALIRVAHVDNPEQTRLVELDLEDETSMGEMSTAGLPPGTYEVEFTIHGAEGNAFARNDPGQTFALAEPEAWWHNTLGLHDRVHDIVPPPWTPMEVEDDNVKCWGRTIRFAANPLPEQIISAGDNLLAAPMTLDFEIGDEPLEFDVDRIDYPVVSKAAVERTWTGTADGVSLTVHTRIEFDGFMWIRTSVTNDNDKAISGLTYRMPCVKRNARFIHTPSRGWRGEMPPDLTTKEPWHGQFGGFSQPVWLGGYERGLQWLAEGREGWFNKDKSDEIRVWPENDRVTLAVKMIDSPTSRDSFDIEFGLHPTPIKPPIARSKRRGPTGCWSVVPTLPRPSPNSGMTEKEFWAADRKRRETNPEYFRYSFINSVASYYGDGTEIRERKWYKDEWENIPGYERLEPLSWSWFSACAETSYADWWVWFIKNRWLHPDYGIMAGIYIDHGSPVRCSNPLHNGKCGYLDENGVRQADYQIVAMRNLLKRIYMVAKGIDEEHPTGATPDYPIVLHTSTQIIAPHVSFAFVFDGETWKVPDGHFMDRLTLDFMATEWSHTTWGYYERSTCFKHSYFYIGFDPELMKEISELFQAWRRTGLNPKRLEELRAHPGYDKIVDWGLARTRELNALFFLFDRTATDVALSYFLGYEKYGEGLDRMYQTFGFYEDDVEFMGFWKTGDIVGNQDDKLKASIYLRDNAGKALLAISNLRDNAVARAMPLDTEKLGLEGEFSVTNAATGESIPVEKDGRGRLQLPIQIPGRDYILVLARTN